MSPTGAIHRADYAPPAYLVPSAHLEFDLGLEETVVRSRLQLSRNPFAQQAGPCRLDGSGITPEDILIDGRPPAAGRVVVSDAGLEIRDPPDRFELRVTTRLKPERNTSLLGLYATQGQLCTHCEPHGFRRITYFPDRPDVLARFSVRMTADRDAYPVLLANGNPVGEGLAEGNRHWAQWEDPFPKPSYLFAAVAGRFARRSFVHRTPSGREITFSIYATQADLPHLGFALDQLLAAVRWDEIAYGRECDLDVYNVVTVADHNFGAMENKGLNIFSRGSIVTTDGRYTTDDDYALISLNIAHEYFHNWTGNRITCRDWFQLALKEGLTTYRTEQFEEEKLGRPGSRVAWARNVKTKIFAEESAASVHPVLPESYVEVANLYNSTVYLKGATIVRMLHLLCGEEAYKRGCDIFFNRFDGQAVTVEELVAAIEEASGRDLGQFRRWYEQAGTPVIRASDEFDAASATYRLTLSQELPRLERFAAPAPLHVPVKVGLLTSKGEAIGGRSLPGCDASGSILLELRDWTHTYVFKGISERPIPSLLRDLSAPAKVEFNYSRSQLNALARCDTDAINRWDAMQRSLADAVLGDGDLDGRSQGALLDALRDTLRDPELDPGLIAEIVSLPHPRELAERMQSVDVDRLCDRLGALRSLIAVNLVAPLRDRYESLASPGPYRFDPPAAARRRLRNVCLSYLVRAGDHSCIRLAVAQAQSAENMTDEVAAGAAINAVAGPERDDVLALLFRRWRTEPLALDKWFQLQALDERPDVLDRIRSLAAHPDFDMTRVSRVRALFAWFFLLNFRGFHDANGAAYEYMVDVVRQIDRLNGMSAAWLLRKSDLMRWRRFSGPWRERMRDSLRRLLEAPGLTAGTRERTAEALSES